MSPEEIIAEAKTNDVTKLITIGTSTNDANLVIEAAKKFDNVYCTLGIYPHEDLDKSVEDLQSYLEKKLKEYPEVLGIGECGIDVTDWQGGRIIEDQKELFEMQVNVAIENSLPVVIHNRKGEKEILEILERYKGMGLRGLIHCFDSNSDFAKKVLDMGFYISFSGMITYPQKTDVVEVAKNVPLNRFLVETDAPYLKPWTVEDEANYPKYVRIIAEKIAQVKQIPFEKICELSYQNTCSIFCI